MPVPYMGSKRRSVGKIFSTIRNLEPEGNVLVDLFCGGLAISEYFIKNGWTVIANDKNKYVVELIREAVNGRFNDEVFTPEFITKDMFKDVITNTQKYDDWYVGYVQCVWSFGNSQRNYIFGKDVEPIKRAGHELVINKDRGLIDKLGLEIPERYMQGILKQDNWHKRRVALAKVSHAMSTRVLELQRLQQLQRLEQLERLERLQQLEQLERLQQLEQLQRLEQLELYSKDYREILIPEGAVIYCDPPYQGTAEYKESDFNHTEFWDWVRKTSKIHPVYISEYNAPEDFEVVLRFKQNSTLSGGNNKGQPSECLFRLRE
jgi:site-specific DNA-adenine methylase